MPALLSNSSKLILNLLKQAVQMHSLFFYTFSVSSPVNFFSRFACPFPREIPVKIRDSSALLKLHVHGILYL